MASFYVLTAPAATDRDADTKFIRDGFSWLGFLLPLPWLLFKRLWLIGLVAILLTLVAFLAVEQYRLDALPIAFSLLLSLWVGFEGGHTRARSLERRGWQIECVIAADRLEDAEAIYFAEKAANAPKVPEQLLPVLPARKALASTNIAALGLIDPNGNR